MQRYTKNGTVKNLKVNNSIPDIPQYTKFPAIKNSGEFCVFYDDITGIPYHSENDS